MILSESICIRFRVQVATTFQGFPFFPLFFSFFFFQASGYFDMHMEVFSCEKAKVGLIKKKDFMRRFIVGCPPFPFYFRTKFAKASSSTNYSFIKYEFWIMRGWITFSSYMLYVCKIFKVIKINSYIIN